MLEPGEQEVRNPRIVTAFRRIGLSEHAGWGLRKVFRNWQQLGNIPPQITNDKTNKTFELTLLKELLLSEEQLLFQSALGVHLDEQEARAFAYVCRRREVTLSELKAVTNLSGPEVRKIADRLCVQALLKPSNESENYRIADHLRDRFLPQKSNITAEQEKSAVPDLLTEQVYAKSVDLLTDQVDAKQVDLSSEQVGTIPADLFTEQVDEKQADLSREQVDERTADLLTDQVDTKQVDLSSDQVDAKQADVISEQVGAEVSDLCPEQVKPLKSLNENQWRIVSLCEVPRTLAEIMAELGVGSRYYFNIAFPIQAQGRHPENCDFGAQCP